jgi:hypothetical protein
MVLKLESEALALYDELAPKVEQKLLSLEGTVKSEKETQLVSEVVMEVKSLREQLAALSGELAVMKKLVRLALHLVMLDGLNGL